MKIAKMSEAEKEVMQIIWASGSPVTSAKILAELSQERDVKITTVLTFLTRLTEKGLIVCQRIGKKNYYVSLLSEREYKKFESKKFLSAIHGGSIKNFLAALCDDGDISNEEIEELKNWLSQR